MLKVKINSVKTVQQTVDKGTVLFLFFFTLLAGIVTLRKKGAYWNSL